MSEQFDLVVVGGGLGGSALAKCMAEQGTRVLVLERDPQFKDRVRGEFLSPWGVAEAGWLGIDGVLRRQCAHEVPWVDFFSGNIMTMHRHVETTTPHQLPCLAFFHPAMQEVLIEAAVNAGAQVRRGISVQEVRPGSPAVVVVGSNGRSEEVRARLVVGADGRSSSVRALSGFKVRRDPEMMLVAGVAMEDMPAPEDTGQIVINSTLGQLATIFPQGGGRARVYLCYQAGTRPRHQGVGDLPRFIVDCLNTGVNPDYYKGARAAGPLATFDGADTWVEHPYKDGVALIGDAAATSDPSWGQGLASTLRDVRLLRDQLLKTEDWNAAGHNYAGEHDSHAEITRTVNGWYTEFFLSTGNAADERRDRALPLIAEDPTRQPDTLFSGPDRALNEADRKRFFAEGESPADVCRDRLMASVREYIESLKTN